MDFFTARRACHLLLAAVFTAVAALVIPAPAAAKHGEGEDPKVATIKAAISGGTSTADQRSLSADTLGIPVPGAGREPGVVAPGVGRVA